MLTKIELTKKVREIRTRLSDYMNEHEQQPPELYGIEQMVRELEDGMNTPEPKTIGEALQQFQQHQEEAHQAQKELLEGLKNIQKNV